jgi:hypothetical protein
MRIPLICSSSLLICIASLAFAQEKKCVAEATSYLGAIVGADEEARNALLKCLSSIVAGPGPFGPQWTPPDLNIHPRITPEQNAYQKPWKDMLLDGPLYFSYQPQLRNGFAPDHSSKGS